MLLDLFLVKMSWRKNKQEIIKKAKIRFDEEAFLSPSQVIKEFCDEYGIKQEELNDLFQWFADPTGDYLYFVTKTCDLDVANLKTKQHKTILSSLTDYVNDFNKVCKNIDCYLKINMACFLNKKLYFVSRFSYSQRIYECEPFDKKSEDERFMQSFYEFALTKIDHSQD